MSLYRLGKEGQIGKNINVKNLLHAHFKAMLKLFDRKKTQQGISCNQVRSRSKYTLLCLRR